MTALYDRLRETVNRLVNKYGDLVTWKKVTNNAPSDSDKPWDFAADTTLEHTVRVVFNIDDLEDRQFFHYMKKSNIGAGLVNGIIGAQSFTPEKKDTVIRDGQELVITAIDPIKPGDTLLGYYIEYQK